MNPLWCPFYSDYISVSGWRKLIYAPFFTSKLQWNVYMENGFHPMLTLSFDCPKSFAVSTLQNILPTEWWKSDEFVERKFSYFFPYTFQQRMDGCCLLQNQFRIFHVFSIHLIRLSEYYGMGAGICLYANIARTHIVRSSLSLRWSTFFFCWWNSGFADILTNENSYIVWQAQLLLFGAFVWVFGARERTPRTTKF